MPWQSLSKNQCWAHLKLIFFTQAICDLFPPHYLFHQEDNYSLKRQIFLFQGKYRCMLNWTPSLFLFLCLSVSPSVSSPTVFVCHCILSITNCDHWFNEVRRLVCSGPGWWVWVVIGCWSLLIWYGVWRRSLIRGCSSQQENRLSITTRVPLAQAKWDGSRGRGRRGGCNLERGLECGRKDKSPRKLSTVEQKWAYKLYFFILWT